MILYIEFLSLHSLLISFISLFCILLPYIYLFHTLLSISIYEIFEFLYFILSQYYMRIEKFNYLNPLNNETDTFDNNKDDDSRDIEINKNNYNRIHR